MISPEKTYTLAPYEKQHYVENGYVLVKAVFSRDEAGVWRANPALRLALGALFGT